MIQYWAHKSESQESDRTSFEFLFSLCLLRFSQQSEMLNWPLRSAQLLRDHCVHPVQRVHMHQWKHLVPAGNHFDLLNNFNGHSYKDALKKCCIPLLFLETLWSLGFS